MESVRHFRLSNGEKYRKGKVSIMKKKNYAVVSMFIMMMCALCLSACSVSVTKAPDSTKAPDEAEVNDLNHKLYEANQLDAIYGRHESVSYTFTYPEDHARDGYVWENADSAYWEWVAGSAEYSRDRVYYEMDYDAETDEMITRCGFNCDPEYNPFYCFFEMSEEEFLDKEQHDHFTEIRHENGVIRTAARFDETVSREWIEDIWGLEYNGQYVRSESVINEDNYEFISNSLIMVEDDKDAFSFVTTVEYDVPEPVASRNLRAAYERKSENMMNLNFVADPGTDHEITRKVTVPINSDVSIKAGDVPFAFFNDPDCETLKHWDRISDNSYYIITNPDEALTEKFEKMFAEANGQ